MKRKPMSAVELMISHDPDRSKTLLGKFVAIFRKPRLSQSERQILIQWLAKLKADIQAMPDPDLGPNGTIFPKEMFALVFAGAKIERILASR